MKKSLILFSFIALLTGTSKAQLIIDNTTQTPTDLVTNVLAGSGVQILNVQFNASVPLGAAVQSQVGYFDATATSFPIAEGVIIGTGNVQAAIGPNNSPSLSNNAGVAPDPSDPDLNSPLFTSSAPYNNEAILEFDFIPQGDSILFNYVFASEEYHEYSTSVNDAFGFFISGPGFAGPYTNGGVNIAIVPGTANTPVAMNTINNGSSNTGPCVNCAYLVDNTGGTDLQYDGHTVVLQAAASVQCGQTYHIKMAIGDALDQGWDSAVFLEASSFSSNGADIAIELVDLNGDPIQGNELIEGCTGAQISFIKPDGYTDSTFIVNIQVGGTATNGTDYTTINPNYTIPPGDDTLTISINALQDGVPDPGETLILTTFYITECGDTVTVSDTINIVDTAPAYNVLTTDIVIDCPTMNLPVSATTDGGIPNLTYDWGPYGFGQTVNVPGNMGGTTNYPVTVTDACGVVSNGSINVTLNAGPTPTINFNQNTFVICPGNNVFIDATLNNPYDPTQVTYSWSPTGDVTEDITVSPVAVTWYILTAMDGCYTTMDSVKVDMGTATLTNIAITGATDCPNQGSFVPGTVSVLPDSSTWNYTLTGAGNTYGPQASGNFGNLTGGISYFLHVENSLGCTVDSIIFVPTTGAPMFAVLDSISHVDCEGDDNGTAYVSGITGGPGGPNYDVTWTHITNGIHFQETVGGMPADGSSNQTDLYGGQWSVVVLDQAGCAWEELFVINEPDELIIDWVANDVVCYGDDNGSVIVNPQGGNGGNQVYIYDDFIGGNIISSPPSQNANLLDIGWYYATVTDSKGCTTSDSVYINEPGQFSFNLVVNNPLCYGVASGSASVVGGTNAQGPQSTWIHNWVPNPSGIPNSANPSTINLLGEGQYIVNVQDSAGCSSQQTFNIVYPQQMVFDTLGYNPAQCRLYPTQNGNGTVFAAGSGGTGSITYLWTNLGNNTTSVNTTWGGLNYGSYHISMEDDNGCFLIDTVHLDSVSPIAAFDVASAEFLTPGVCEGTAVVNVNFTNASQNYIDPFNVNSIPDFYWTMDSTNTVPWYLTHDFLEQLDTTYGTAGVYPVCLKVINDNGCEDVTCKDMIIHDQLSFTPVNVFTPNGDGDNDVFTFANWAAGVATFQCTFVNRWGQQVYQMNDINDVWTGVNQSGNALPDGIYYYTYSGVATDGTVFSGQGFTYILGSGL